jgi:hypothetical protein
LTIIVFLKISCIITGILAVRKAIIHNNIYIDLKHACMTRLKVFFRCTLSWYFSKFVQSASTHIFLSKKVLIVLQTREISERCHLSITWYGWKCAHGSQLQSRHVFTVNNYLWVICIFSSCHKILLHKVENILTDVRRK